MEEMEEQNALLKQLMETEDDRYNVSKKLVFLRDVLHS